MHTLDWILVDDVHTWLSTCEWVVRVVNAHLDDMSAAVCTKVQENTECMVCLSTQAEKWLLMYSGLICKEFLSLQQPSSSLVTWETWDCFFKTWLTTGLKLLISLGWGRRWLISRIPMTILFLQTSSRIYWADGLSRKILYQLWKYSVKPWAMVVKSLEETE